MGKEVGITVGRKVGIFVGITDGSSVGITVGNTVGRCVGDTVGTTVGVEVGTFSQVPGLVPLQPCRYSPSGQGSHAVQTPGSMSPHPTK